MEPIELYIKEERDTGWDVVADVGHNTVEIGFLVHVDKAYWNELTGESISPKDLVRKTFEFLLKRETLTEILREFNLRDVQRYFPEYEEEMKRLFLG